MAMILIGNFLAMPVFAGDSVEKRAQKAAKVEEKLKKFGVGDKVKVDVKLYDDTRYQGYVREASDDGFVVVDNNSNSHSIKYGEVKSVKGKNLGTGAKIGIGIAIGAGITLLIVALIVHSND